MSSVGSEREKRIKKRLEKVPFAVLSESGRGGDEVEIVFLGNAAMKRLKTRFTGKTSKGIVDVLAFPEPKNFPHPESRRKFLGEVYLNRNLVRKGDLPRLGFLLIHGVLHLLGFAHERKGDILKMERRERTLMRKIFKTKDF